MPQLGPYQLLRRIGRGGMAEVWSAKRTAGIGGADKFVAIKLLAPHLAEQSTYRDMFLAEARLSMLLNHSNIVQVFDAIEDPPDCYMVMELVEGMTLSQLERVLAKQGAKIPLDVAAYVVGELLRALAHAHAVSLDAGSVIVHRDVSPQNVMVTTAGEVKLMDFGIARFASEDTQGTFIKGKLQYMPPEQLRRETRRPTIDLFAVGAILHELIDGRRFRGKIDEARLLGMVIQGEVPTLQTSEGVPIELDQLRLALLEPAEDLRIQSAKEALQLLQSWPGYRHAALELEELVQRFVAPASAMSAPEPESESEDGELEVQQADSGPDLPAIAASSSESLMRRIDPGTATETSEAGVEGTEDAFEPISTVAFHPAALRRRWLGVSAVLLMLGAIAGTAWFLIERAQAPSDPSDAPIEIPTPQPDPRVPAGPPVEPDQIVEQEPLQEEAPRVLVWVEFVTDEFTFAQVRVNGRVLEPRPRSRVRLPVGSFGVYMRTRKDRPWTKAGRLTLEAQHEYRVHLRKPSGLTVVEMD